MCPSSSPIPLPGMRKKMAEKTEGAWFPNECDATTPAQEAV